MELKRSGSPTITCQASPLPKMYIDNFDIMLVAYEANLLSYFTDNNKNVLELKWKYSVYYDSNLIVTISSITEYSIQGDNVLPSDDEITQLLKYGYKKLVEAFNETKQEYSRHLRIPDSTETDFEEYLTKVKNTLISYNSI